MQTHCTAATSGQPLQQGISEKKNCINKQLDSPKESAPHMNIGVGKGKEQLLSSRKLMSL